MSTIPQLAELKRRKSSLSIQQARYGISADPHISIEVSDLEKVIGLMERIDIHRRNLDHLTQQRDRLGTHAPPHVLTQIADERTKIAELRNVCARMRYPVDRHPLDDDPPVELPMPDPPAPPAQTIVDPTTARLVRIEQKLDEILRRLQ